MCHVGIYPNEPHVTVFDMFESSTEYLDFLIILCTIFLCILGEYTRIPQCLNSWRLMRS